MTRRMNPWRALLAASLWLAALPGSAQSCRPVSSISEAKAAQHEFVLKAKVIRVRPAESGGIVPVMFTVIREYRGAPPQILTVYFDPAGDGRELNFHPGDVFAISTVGSGRSVGNACTLRKLVGVSR
jgi:hypothetical protein